MGISMSFINYLISGISLGSVYALIALGYTMVYGIAKMLNFAHGDVIMVGAFATYTICSTMGLSPVIGVLVAIVLCTLLGMAVEKVAYKPLRKASSPLAVLITAIGVSYLLQNVALLIFGTNTKAFTSVVPVSPLKLSDGQIVITGETIVTIISCIVGCSGRCSFMLCIPVLKSLYRFHARYQGVCRCGIWWNRFYSRCFYRWSFTWNY